MPDKFQNKYRIPSARLKNWDYRTNAMYFVTICTKNREHYFGEIENGEMILSDIGKLCDECLKKIPEHFPYVLLDESIVMPNHIHAIIVIDNPLDIRTTDNPSANAPENMPANPSVNAPVNSSVETLHATSLPGNVPTENTEKQKNITMASISPKSGSLSTILRSFKSAVTKEANLTHAGFEWQSRFHDHIIRNNESYHQIKKYIETNPQNWDKDKFNN